MTRAWDTLAPTPCYKVWLLNFADGRPQWAHILLYFIIAYYLYDIVFLGKRDGKNAFAVHTRIFTLSCPASDARQPRNIHSFW